MKVNFEIGCTCKNKKDWGVVLIPTISIGYCDKFFCFSLYVFAWEFSIDFNWDKI